MATTRHIYGEIDNQSDLKETLDTEVTRADPARPAALPAAPAKGTGEMAGGDDAGAPDDERR